MSFDDTGSEREAGSDPMADPIDDGIAVGNAPEPNPNLEDIDHSVAVQIERDEYLASLQRLQADFENYKKRVARLEIEQASRAAKSLVEKLLPVLDTFDLGLAHGVEDSVALAQTRAQLVSVLEKEGLEKIDAIDVEFDPVIHDAVAHEENDGSVDDEGVMVVEVLRAGYLWQGSILRPAMVRVKG